jgi:TatD DNase family protein
MTNIVDSHCHLDFKDFQDDLDLVIKKAYNSNVKHMLSISVNLEDFNNVYKVANSYDNIYCTTGIHPNNVPENKNNELLFEKLSLNLNKKKVIGVGETGLDFYRNEENRINQIEYFNTHLEVSGLFNYPTIVHTRNAEKDTINCIEKAVKKHSTKGLIHCFTSTMELAKKVLDEGFYISFSGIITFKKVDDLIDVVKYVPLDRILVETDAPFLAPMPFRGKRNEPSFVTHTLKKIAEIKRKNVEDMAQITTDNFFNLFSNLS